MEIRKVSGGSYQGFKEPKVRLETQMAQFESQGNLEEASKIKYQTIPAINKRNRRISG